LWKQIKKTTTMKTTTYQIQDREAGNVIEVFSSFADAQNAILKYENDDKADGNFTPDFYEIVAVENNGHNSPKNKYMATVYYAKPSRKNYGAANCFTANTEDAALNLAKSFLVDKASIAIFENRLAYPKFDWIQISINHF